MPLPGLGTSILHFVAPKYYSTLTLVCQPVFSIFPCFFLPILNEISNHFNIPAKSALRLFLYPVSGCSHTHCLIWTNIAPNPSAPKTKQQCAHRANCVYVNRPNTVFGNVGERILPQAARTLTSHLKLNRLHPFRQRLHPIFRKLLQKLLQAKPCLLHYIMCQHNNCLSPQST